MIERQYLVVIDGGLLLRYLLFQEQAQVDEDQERDEPEDDIEQNVIIAECDEHTGYVGEWGGESPRGLAEGGVGKGRESGRERRGEQEGDSGDTE